MNGGGGLRVDNPAPVVFRRRAPRRPKAEVTAADNDQREAFDAGEIFEHLRNISDPEHPYTLEQLNVITEENIHVDDAGNRVEVYFTPTVSHCSMATLIGLCVRVQLLRALPRRFKVDIYVSPGSHSSEHAVNKQLNDKERVAAALENPTLQTKVNLCLSVDPWYISRLLLRQMSTIGRQLARAAQSSWRSLAAKPWLDGNLWWCSKHQSGYFVGTDRFGNKYFENRHAQSTRFRWVRYVNTEEYSANDVPPEWFGWLHAINDWPPTSDDTPPGMYAYPSYEQFADAEEPAQQLDHPISDYEPAVYMPKGYPKHRGGRWPVESHTIERWRPGAKSAMQRAALEENVQAATITPPESGAKTES